MNGEAGKNKRLNSLKREKSQSSFQNHLFFDKGSNMREIHEHQIYDLLKDKFSRIECDYAILLSDDDYRGIETHKKAVIQAFEIWNDRSSSYGSSIDIEADKMTAVRNSVDELLALPSDEAYGPGRKTGNRAYTAPAPIPYWYAFLEPPRGTSYPVSDFVAFHDILIPHRNESEVFRWNDAFSNYFDAGKEWWGTGLWSIYDPITSVFVIIGASLTD